jgi:hypothetical protein
MRDLGIAGYGIWWALLEELYQAEPDGYTIAPDDMWWSDTADKFKIAEDEFRKAVQYFAKVKLIDGASLQEGVILCPGVVDRGDDYTRKKAMNSARQKRFYDKHKEPNALVTREPNALTLSTQLNSTQFNSTQHTHPPLTPLQAAQRGSEQPEASVCVTASAGSNPEQPEQPQDQTATEFREHLSAVWPVNLNPFTDYADFVKARREASLEQVLAAIAREKPTWERRGENWRYVPKFGNWIRGKPWATLPRAKPTSQKPSQDSKAEFERLKQELRGVKNA